MSAKSLFKYAERIKRQVDTQVTLSIGSEGRGYVKAAFKVKTNEHEKGTLLFRPVGQTHASGCFTPPFAEN